MDQEERLFGAPNRHLSAITLQLLASANGGYTITVAAQPANRRDAMHLLVNVAADASPGPVLGLVQPLLHRWYLSPGSWRRQAVIVADNLGREGYEVSLR